MICLFKIHKRHGYSRMKFYVSIKIHNVFLLKKLPTYYYLFFLNIKKSQSVLLIIGYICELSYDVSWDGVYVWIFCRRCCRQSVARYRTPFVCADSKILSICMSCRTCCTGRISSETSTFVLKHICNNFSFMSDLTIDFNVDGVHARKPHSRKSVLARY